MAPPHIHPNQLHSLFPSSFSTPLYRHCRSKAQMCLFKILHIISVFSAEDVDKKQCLSIDEENCENRVFNVDLNISLRPPTEIEPFDPPVTAENGGDADNFMSTKNNSRNGESYDVERSEVQVEEKGTTEDSKISHVGDQSSGIDYNGVSEEEKRRDEGCLGLLIEAAQLVLGEHESKQLSHKIKPPRSKYVESSAAAEVGRGTKRKQECWTAEWWSEFEGTLPALKSKRGRNVVLPEKYRDSYVEPVIRWTPSAYRSKSQVETVASKRRTKW